MIASQRPGPWLRFWQYAFYPLFIASTFGVCIFLLHRLPEIYWFLIPLGVTTVVLPLVMLSEKLLPYRASWQGTGEDSWADVIRTFVIFPMASLLVLLLLGMVKRHTGFFGEAGGFSGNTAFRIGENVLYFLASDLCYYWVHRAFHNVQLLWPFHAIHHGAKRVYAINSGKFHFVEAFVSGLAYFAPMLLLGASEYAIVLVVTVSLVTGFLEHANIDFKAGVLNYVFNTAELHRWHHSIERRESNSNFGKVLSVWDLVFGTFYFPKDKEVGEVGVRNSAVPTSFVKQLAYPFRKGGG